uniref:Nuclear receptor binding SET domain protein 2 n=1 Tax=Hippocampus comes TaxID=109280 RepID=A0A3Q2YGJ6_HIPCM
MDSKGSSLPSMPEPANPVSMKQPPESRGDPSLLMDQAAAQLAATLQDGVLQKMSGHGHERLKDLTSLVLNSDQDAIPKLCAAETPVLKGAEAPPSNGTHQHTCAAHGEPELKVTVPQVVKAPLFEPCSAGGTSLSAVVAVVQGAAASVPEERQEVKKRRGRSQKPKARPALGSSALPEDALGPALEAPAVVSEPSPVATEAPSLPSSFSVGDVVWTKVSGYPWWPCIVTTDPERNHHVKPKPNAKSRSGFLYHVQYFGDAPERGYIFEKNMVSFARESQYQELSLRNKQPTLPSVPRKMRPQWKMGVIQATEALAMSLDDRLANFIFMYDDNGPHLNPCILDKLKPESSAEAEARLSMGVAAAKDGITRYLQVYLATFKWRSEIEISLSKGEPHPNTIWFHELDKSKLLRARRTNRFVETADERAWMRLAHPEASDVAYRSISTGGGGGGVASVPNMALDVQIQDLTPKRQREISIKLDTIAPFPFRSLEMGHRGVPSQDGENLGEPVKTKKRRSFLCPEPEVSARAAPPPSPPGFKRESARKSSPARLVSSAFGSVDFFFFFFFNDGASRSHICLGAAAQACEQAGEDLVPCEGQCGGMFHLHCLGGSFEPDDKLLCRPCSTGVHPCFTCKQSDGDVRRCHVAHCGKFYHEVCARLSPLTVFDNKGLRCPLHTCLSCHYGCRTQHKSTKGRLMRCLRCPVAYHVGDQCVAAGSEMITNTAIVCTNHFNAKKGYSHHSHVNVSWCFVCSKGGQLLCCESCPAAFHPDCLNIAMPDGSWFCNDCRAGKKPKYRDIIWVKLGTYRWWPAEIQHPRNIPTNIQHLRHQIGEFPVFFFGSKDYFWTHQGRVFPYMEGDRGSKYQKNGIGKVFKTALLEAESRFKEMKMKREAKEAQEKNRKPPPYKFIKVNKAVGKVQVYAADVSEIPKCNCKPSVERPCGFESECLNRMLQYECHPQVCPSGERCCNQDFTKRLYPDTKIIKTPGKGWGLVALRDIKKGEFVNEYVGELIDEDECRARIKHAHENNITDFYMLTIDKDRIIDAGPKGNFSRFMNHSCQPNCETQKWTVNGDTRVGLFAVCDITAGTELTFNYNLDCLGNEKTVCRCGAPNCSGFLGDRPKAADPKGKRLKRKYRKRRTEGKKSDDECFRCGDGGQLVICGKKTCTKAFHLSCLNLSKRPFGRWDCPWHHCDVCGKNSDAFCQLCPNSFCKAHQEGALRAWPPTGQLCCLEHDEHQDAALSAVLAAAAAARPKCQLNSNSGIPHEREFF